jgi:hypothetical protein
VMTALVRHAAIRGELRARRRARIRRVLVRCARGACWGVPVTTLAVVAAFLYFAPRNICFDCDVSRARVTLYMVKHYASQAYPVWAVEHPQRECPGSLQELDAYSSGPSQHRDAWGHPIELRCGRDLPASTHGFQIRSAGPDGEFDTEDDLTSAQ